MGHFVLLVALSIVLFAPVQLDLVGSHRAAVATATCRRLGASYEWNGLTAREREVLVVVRSCRRLSDGTWTTARFFTD
jgi:hypothetical protein